MTPSKKRTPRAPRLVLTRQPARGRAATLRIEPLEAREQPQSLLAVAGAGSLSVGVGLSPDLLGLDPPPTVVTAAADPSPLGEGDPGPVTGLPDTLTVSPVAGGAGGAAGGSAAPTSPTTTAVNPPGGGAEAFSFGGTPDPLLGAPPALAAGPAGSGGGTVSAGLRPGDASPTTTARGGPAGTGAESPSGLTPSLSPKPVGTPAGPGAGGAGGAAPAGALTLPPPAADAAAQATLRLAGPANDMVAPFQRSGPTPGSSYRAEFVVRLKPGVSSDRLAIAYGAKHVYAYPGLDNVNLWQARAGTSPINYPKRLLRDARVLDAYAVYRPGVVKHSLPNDPLLPVQWHLYNVGQTNGVTNGGVVESNVEAAWDTGMTGKGALISVVDDGMEYTHPDLNAHIVQSASYDFLSGDDDPMPTVATDGHGTSVAGVAAAVGNNGIGGSGVAPDALLGSSRLIAGSSISDTQLTDALNWKTTKAASGLGGFDASPIDIYNNSWGFVGPGTLRSNFQSTSSAMSNSAASGRGGLGSIYVFSAGNDRANQDNTNYSGLTNNRYVTTVAAVADDGQIADYSTPGANVLISAPSNGGFSSITTTDRVGSAAGTVGYSTTDYTDTFGGTSSAAPFVSGVIAQMLQANPNLSWRDVQHILARSATRVDPASPGWDADPALPGAQPNGGGRWVSDDYGFGLINAEGAVNLASNWQPVGPELVFDSGQLNVNADIPDNTGAAATGTFHVAPNIRVEHVEVQLTATHPDRGQLEVTLTSPSGTRSVLAATRTNDANPNYSAWTFGTVRDWDEASAGDWTLSVKDNVTGTTGTFGNWRLRVYGTEITGDTPGPRVAGITSPNANGMVNGGPIQVFRVQFDKPINPVTFTPDDITFQRVGGAATPVSQILPVNGAAPSDTTFDVTLADPVSAVGNYRVDIGPNIADPAGTLMNQDGDLTNGEATQDKYTEFVTLAAQFLYFQANNPGWTIPAGGSFTAGVDLPAVNTTDINVWTWALDTFAGNDLKVELQAPDDVFREVARDATPPGNGINGNGFRNTVLDDEAPTTFGVTDNYQYTGSYQPTTTPLTTFEGSKPAGAWNLKFSNVAGAGAGEWYSGLLLTPAGVPNVAINSVTNTDADRDKVEVAYTISNAAPASLDLGVYGSTDPFWNVNSDTQTGTLTITDPALLTVGPHTVKLDAGLFPDPSFAANQQLYSLVVADPQHNLLELAKFDNFGILEGVTQSPDGTLYVAGKPFAANTIKFLASTAAIDFNGTQVNFNPVPVNDIFLTGGTEADTIDTAAAGKNVLAFLGTGNDSYTGGNQIDAVQGGAGHDTLNGNAGADRLYGMIGNDSVSGGAGADTVSVGEGAPGATQTLSGGTEADFLVVSGTSFNDGILVWDPDNSTAAIGPSLQVSVTSPASPPPGMFGVIVQSLTIAGVEPTDTLLVSASYGDDRVELENSAVANSRVRLPAVIFGGPGNDTLVDGLGADRLFADSAYTTLPGDGADVLSSTDGTPGDILVRKAGTDAVPASDAGDTIIDMT